MTKNIIMCLHTNDEVIKIVIIWDHRHTTVCRTTCVVRLILENARNMYLHAQTVCEIFNKPSTKAIQNINCFRFLMKLAEQTLNIIILQ